MREEIEHHAQCGQPNIAALLKGGKIGWPSTSAQTQMFNVENGRPPPIGFVEGFDALGLFAAVFKNELVAHVDKLLISAGKDGLSDEERAKQTSDTAAKLLSVERQICSLIERAQAEWLPVDHTHELNPLAILSVIQVELPTQQGSSPGMGSWLLRRPGGDIR